jgi:hypothetical protein
LRGRAQGVEGSVTSWLHKHDFNQYLKAENYNSYENITLLYII